MVSFSISRCRQFCVLLIALAVVGIQVSGEELKGIVANLPGCYARNQDNIEHLGYNIGVQIVEKSSNTGTGKFGYEGQVDIKLKMGEMSPMSPVQTQLEAIENIDALDSAEAKEMCSKLVNSPNPRQHIVVGAAGLIINKASLLVADTEEGLENGDGLRIDVVKGLRGGDKVALFLSENMPANHFGKLTIQYESEWWRSNGRARGEKNLLNTGLHLFPCIGRGSMDAPVKLAVGLDPALGKFKGMQPKHTEPVGSSRPSKAVFEGEFVDFLTGQLSIIFGQS